MQIWPAIDLLGGRCVRLEQGDYQRSTAYGDPVETALQFQEQGAEHLHLVDLDGARAGHPVNLPAVRRILESVDLECELGGGIRDEETVVALLEMGLSRLVLGTSAAKRPEWFCALCQRFPGRLALGLDARDGTVATHGWLQSSGVLAIDLANQFRGAPLAALIYTDIATDGMLQGPNVAAMRAMQAAVEFDVVASGGVTTTEDVAALADAGLAGAIVGKALYAGRLSLPDALAAARRGAQPNPAQPNPDQPNPAQTSGAQANRLDTEGAPRSRELR